MTAALVVRRTINASAERLFQAWTEPAQLRQWWGPAGVDCTGAEVDLRAGGAYRIANRFPDGRIVWITGKFEEIDAPRRLVYTWQIDPASVPERVTIQFEPRGNATEVIVTHERIETRAAREEHARGWHACLEGLGKYAGG
jgi:glutathione S-transferase